MEYLNKSPEESVIKVGNKPHLDIFCEVIDNFGDIGTCWRLALQFQYETPYEVTLWVDDLSALKALVPGVNESQRQTYGNVEVVHWCSKTVEVFDFTDIPDVVIEAFGCTLPENYILAMQQKTHRPVWINLEYFSCESWVEGCHGLPSLQNNGLSKWFYFPGFMKKTGGMLRENNYTQRRNAFLNPENQADWLIRNRIPKAKPESLKISLFAYENPAINQLLEYLEKFDKEVDVYLPEGRLQNSLNEKWFCRMNSDINSNLRLHGIGFMPQSEFDGLLWYCDVNFVRGEESLNRAIWAEKPFIWHIYPTEDNAHWDKLEAFIERFKMPVQMAQLTLEWNAKNVEPNTFESVFLCHKDVQLTLQNQSVELWSQKSLVEQLNSFIQTHSSVL